MLRAVRLAAKLGIAIEPKTAAPIAKLAPLIGNVPPARLFDEMQKLLLSGHAVATREEPARARALARPAAAARRRSSSSRSASGSSSWRSPTPTSASATSAAYRRDSCSRRCCGTRCSRRGTQRRRAARRRSRRCSTAMDLVLERQAKQLAIPRRFEATIKEIWSLQPRFEQRSGQRPFRLLEHPRLPRRLGLPRAALQERRARRRARRPRRLVGPLRRTPATTSAMAMLKPDEGPKKKRRSRGRGRKRREAMAARVAARRPTPRRNDRVRLRRASAATSRIRAASSRARCARSRGCRVRASSACRGNYVSDPVGCPEPQPEFVNAVAALETTLPPMGIAAAAPRHRAPAAPGATPPAQRRAHARPRPPALRARALAQPAVSSCRIRAWTSARSCCAHWSSSLRT